MLRDAGIVIRPVELAVQPTVDGGRRVPVEPLAARQGQARGATRLHRADARPPVAVDRVLTVVRRPGRRARRDALGRRRRRRCRHTRNVNVDAQFLIKSRYLWSIEYLLNM